MDQRGGHFAGQGKNADTAAAADTVHMLHRCRQQVKKGLFKEETSAVEAKEKCNWGRGASEGRTEREETE